MLAARQALALALALCSACMLSPENGEHVPSNGVVSFWGQGTEPGQVFDIQSAPTATGPFVTIATVSTEATPTTLGGSSVYEWRADAAIESWTDVGGCEQEAFIRVSTGPYYAMTFDESQGLECILEHYFGGTELYNAALACQSDDSPIARVSRTSSTTHVGDVVIATAADADALACVGVIEGSLSIVDDPSAMSIHLPDLTAISGDLELVYSRDPLSPATAPVLREISLPALTSVGGSVHATYPGDSGDLASLDLGLDAVESVGADVSVWASTFNLDISGLGGLTSIPGDLTVVSTGSDYTAYGLLGSLSSVGGDVTLEAGHTAIGVWPNLLSVGGSLVLDGVLLPPDTSNLQSLQVVSGDLWLRHVDAIAFVGMPEHFPALTSVGGTLRLDAVHEFEWFALGDVSAGLDVGGLHAEATSLTQLEPPHVVVDGSGTISIVDHVALSACQVDAFADDQAALGWMGALVNAGNAGC